jgi:hypothetical protein
MVQNAATLWLKSQGDCHGDIVMKLYELSRYQGSWGSRGFAHRTQMGVAITPENVENPVNEWRTNDY